MHARVHTHTHTHTHSFIYLTVLGLHCHVGFSLVVASRGYSLIVVVASPVAEHGL